jgi:hypothetical protein
MTCLRNDPVGRPVSASGWTLTGGAGESDRHAGIDIASHRAGPAVTADDRPIAAPVVLFAPPGMCARRTA